MSKELSIKQNMLWNSAGSLTNLVCQWLITVLVVRLTGGYDLAGTYSLAVSVYGIFSPIAQYRMYTYQISDVNKENSTSEYFGFRIITCALSLILCMGYALLTCPSSAFITILLFSIYKAISLAIDVFHATDQQHHRMDYIGKSLAMQGIASLFVFILIMFFLKNLELALGLMSIAILQIGIFYDYPRTKQFDTIHCSISKRKAICLFKKCAPIVIASIALSAASSIPRQFLFDIQGEAALGIYTSVAAPVAIVQMGASYIYNPLIGYFSEYYFKKDRADFVNLLQKAIFGIVCIGAVSVVLLMLFGKWILILVFGQSIAEYIYLLYPLLLFTFLTAFLWFANDLLIALRCFKNVFVGSTICLIAAISSMVPCINIWGMNGVSFCGIVSSILGIAYMFVIIFKRLKRLQ